MSYEEKRILEYALRYLGRSTEYQLQCERMVWAVHGLIMSGLICHTPSPDLILIDKVISDIALREFDKIPKMGVER